MAENGRTFVISGFNPTIQPAQCVKEEAFRCCGLTGLPAIDKPLCLKLTYFKPIFRLQKFFILFVTIKAKFLLQLQSKFYQPVQEKTIALSP